MRPLGQSRRVEVKQTHALDLAAERPRELDERLGAALVEHLDRLAASRATPVVAPTREVLGDQDEFLHAALGERARLGRGSPRSTASAGRRGRSGWRRSRSVGRSLRRSSRTPRARVVFGRGQVQEVEGGRSFALRRATGVDASAVRLSPKPATRSTSGRAAASSSP